MVASSRCYAGRDPSGDLRLSSHGRRAAFRQDGSETVSPRTTHPHTCMFDQRPRKRHTTNVLCRNGGNVRRAPAQTEHRRSAKNRTPRGATSSYSYRELIIWRVVEVCQGHSRYGGHCECRPSGASQLTHTAAGTVAHRGNHTTRSALVARALRTLPPIQGLRLRSSGQKPLPWHVRARRVGPAVPNWSVANGRAFPPKWSW